MKIVILVFILAGLHRDSNWLNNVQLLIHSIDEKAIFKKACNQKDFVHQRFVYGNYIKDEFQLKGNDFIIEEGNITVYLEKKRILCQKRFLTTKYLKKNDWGPDMIMAEEIWYFESELNGIALKRSIDFDDDNHKDSVELVLKTRSYDTLKIDNSYYIKAKRIHNNFFRLKLFS